MHISPKKSDRSSCGSLAGLFGILLIAIECAPGDAGFQYVSGSYEGQLGCGLILESLVNDGYFSHWHNQVGATLPPDGYAASVDEIAVGQELIGFATVTLSREASARARDGELAILLHTRIEAVASVGTGLGYWQVASPDPGANPYGVAHADSRCRELTYELTGDPGQSVGDPLEVDFNAALRVSHRINGTGYGAPADVAAYHVSGYLSGEDSTGTTFTIYRKPFDGSTGFLPLLQVKGQPDRTMPIFVRERRQLHVGDQIRIHGGVQPYLNAYHHEEERGAEVGVEERVIAEHRFTLDACVVNATSPPAPVVLGQDVFAVGDLSGWTPYTGPLGSVGTDPRPDDPENIAVSLRAGEVGSPVGVTKSFDCGDTVDLQFDYLNLARSEGRIEVRLGGQTLDLLTLGRQWSFASYRLVLDPADFALTPGEMELALEFTTSSPDTGVLIDNVMVRTWNEADDYAAWAAGYGVGAAGADDDGDGTANGDEFVLGFDPTDPAETFALRLVAVDPDTGRVEFRIACVKPNGVYRLYSADSPTTDPGQAILRAEIRPTTAAAGVPVAHAAGMPVAPRLFYFLSFEQAE